MNLRLIYFLFFSSILSLISCSQNQRSPSKTEVLSEFQLTTIDSICRSFLEKGNTQGFSIAIGHDDTIVFSKGYGFANINSKTPVTENTIFAIASISKFITAVSTMKMVEENKLSLQDKVVDHLPDFPDQKFMDQITIEHLLRHQSGLIDHENWFDSIYIIEKRVFTQKEFLDFIDQPLFFKPGSHYSYSNSGYAILSYILEKVSGLPFHDFILEKVSKPNDLNSIGMWPKMWNNPNASMGYELTEDGIDTSFHMMTKGMKGDGGLAASTLDLVKLIQTITKNKFISEASLNQILSPSQIGDLTIDYGLGVKIGKLDDQKTWGHSGGYAGTGWAMLAHYPDSDFTFAAAINTSFSPEEAWLLRHKIMPEVLNIDWPEMDTSTIKNIDIYPGEYVAMDRWGNKIPSKRILSIEEGKLIWDNPQTLTPGARLFPIGMHSFTWKAYPFDEFKFHVLDGKVVACSEYIDGFFVKIRMKKE